eukprot:2086252-Amphidinium_carterae.1
METAPALCTPRSGRGPAPTRHQDDHHVKLYLVIPSEVGFRATMVLLGVHRGKMHVWLFGSMKLLTA